MVWNWCRRNIHPYDIDILCEEIENRKFGDPYFHEYLQRKATFESKNFVSDFCKLGIVLEYYDALQKVRYEPDLSAGRNLYYEGNVCDCLTFLEKYRQYTDDAEYLQHISEDYEA